MRTGLQFDLLSYEDNPTACQEVVQGVRQPKYGRLVKGKVACIQASLLAEAVSTKAQCDLSSLVQ